MTGRLLGCFRGFRFCSYRLLVLLVVSSTTPSLSAFRVEAREITSTPAHVYASTTALIVDIIENECYRTRPLNDELSAQILDRYLHSLDPDRNVFLREDIASFERYRTQLDDAMREGELEPIFAIFDVFRARMKQRSDFAESYLQGAIELDTDESYSLRGNHQPWAASQHELDKIWRQRIKNDSIGLRLSGQTPTRATRTLRTRYRQLTKHAAHLERHEVYRIFINAYLSLLDPHSAYYLPRPLRRSRDPTGPALEGIGVQLRRDNDLAVVKRIFAGGSADRSGELHRGDRIIGVADGAEGEMTDVVAWTLEDIVTLIRGPRGTMVRLQILPKDAPLHGSHRLVTLTRDRIRLQELRTSKTIIALSNGDHGYRIGVIKIPRFYMDYAGYGRGAGNYTSTTRDVERLIAVLEEENTNGLIIDLRGNRGGALLEAVGLTGLFIASGPVVQVRDATQYVEIYRDSDNREVYSGPLAVLVDRYSASASEIFAGAIQDYGRGIIVGEQSYGKGSVQQTIDLNRPTTDANASFGQLVITVAQYFRITGDSTQLRGVLPNIVLSAHPSPRVTGEASEPNALPWERIAPLDFKPFANALQVSPEIRQRHLMRLHEGVPLHEAHGTARSESAAPLSNKLSLNLKSRHRLLQAAKQARRERENAWRHALGLKPLSETQLDDGQLQQRWADKVLVETAEILADAIAQRQ